MGAQEGKKKSQVQAPHVTDTASNSSRWTVFPPMQSPMGSGFTVGDELDVQVHFPLHINRAYHAWS